MASQGSVTAEKGEKIVVWSVINRLILALIYLVIVVLIIAMVGYYIVKLPVSPDAKRFSHLAFLHRALMSPYPENSLPGIQAACQAGVKAIELDVLLTKDNQLVVFHDRNMKDLLGKDAWVENTGYDEIKKLSIKNSDTPVPLLSDIAPVIKHCNSVVELDVRSPNRPQEMAKQLVNVFKQYQLHSQVFVSSLYPIPLYFVRKDDPNIVTSYAIWPNVFRHKTLNAFIMYLNDFWILEGLGVGLVEPRSDIVSEARVTFYRAHHYYVNTWTVNNALAKQYFFNVLGISYTTDCEGINKTCPARHYADYWE